MSKCDAKFRDGILLKCYEEFANRGFSRFRKRDIDRPLNADFSCWVGLNTGLYSDHFTINPFVGIHAAPINRLASKCGNKKYDRSIATYAIHMGELKEAEEEAAFVLDPSQSDDFINAEVDRLVNLYQGIGTDYARSIASYPKLLTLLRERETMWGGYPQRVACCLYLMDQKAEAKAYSIRKLSEERDYFAGFASNFLELLEQEMD